MKRVGLVAFLLASVLCGRAQSVLFVASGSGDFSQLHILNPADGTSSLVGDMMAGTDRLTVTGMDLHPQTGLIYAVLGSENTPFRQLYRIDPLTALGTLIGSFDPDRISDISFAPDGTLWAAAARGGPIGTINLTTGDFTPLGANTGLSGGNGLAFAPNGTLYYAGPLVGGNLYTVNQLDGSLTVVAAFSNVPVAAQNINALVSDASGILYAVTRESPARFLRIDPTTAAVTNIGSLAFSADALVFASIPEPATSAMLVLGLLLLLGARIRRAHRR